MTVSKRVYYRGNVQGVGFRMTTRRIATRYPVGGYVKNLPDGRVEVVVTGEASAVDQFLAAVATHMADYIEDQDIHDESLQAFDTFEIRM